MRFSRRASAVAIVVAVLAASLGQSVSAQGDTAPPSSSTPATVSSDALPTAQVNGVVWDQAIIGHTVYAVGKFTTARPAGSAPGKNTVERANMLAYDIRTGRLISGFRPQFNAEVKSVAASPDGKRVYVGGSFTRVGSVSRSRVAALSATTGAVSGKFRPKANSTVNIVYARGSLLYIGGSFTSVANRSRTRVASLRASDGKLQTFAPRVYNGTVLDIVTSPDAQRVVLGGTFNSANGSSKYGYGLAMVDRATGRHNRTMAISSIVRNGGSKGGITSLRADSSGFYGSGYSADTVRSRLEGSFRATWSGRVVWIEDCHGDTYDMQPIGDVVYSASHKHSCENLGTGGFPQTAPATMRRATATTNYATGTARKDRTNHYYNFGGQPSPSLLTFFPSINEGTITGKKQGPWTVEGTSQYVLYGGEFTTVNGNPQQGLVRFAVASIAPNKDGPAATKAPTLAPGDSGDVTVSWRTTTDRDNENLTYTLFRDTNDQSVHVVQRAGQFWEPATLSFSDTGLTPGDAVQYRVVTSDPWGNTSTSPWTGAVVPGGSDDPTTASDQFTRATTGGWGSARNGGAWSVSSPASSYSVDGSVGKMTLGAAGTSRSASLDTRSTTDTDLTATVSLDAAASGGGTFVALVGRRVADKSYRMKIWLRPAGDVQLQIVKMVSGVESTIGPAVSTGIQHQAGAAYKVRFQAGGVDATTLKAKMWKVGGTEPGWQAQRTDATSGLQEAGSVGLWTYLAADSSTPQTVSFDDVVLGHAGYH